MTSTPNEIEDALASSIDVMRMAEQMLRLRGADSMADYVRDRRIETLRAPRID